MSAERFIDTNVFIHHLDGSDARRHAIAEGIVREGIVKNNACFSFHDSLIVAAALEAGCRRLISEDLQHGLRIESLTIDNPFLT